MKSTERGFLIAIIVITALSLAILVYFLFLKFGIADGSLLQGPPVFEGLEDEDPYYWCDQRYRRCMDTCWANYRECQLNDPNISPVPCGTILTNCYRNCYEGYFGQAGCGPLD